MKHFTLSRNKDELLQNENNGNSKMLPGFNLHGEVKVSVEKGTYLQKLYLKYFPLFIFVFLLNCLRICIGMFLLSLFSVYIGVFTSTYIKTIFYYLLNLTQGEEICLDCG